MSTAERWVRGGRQRVRESPPPSLLPKHAFYAAVSFVGVRSARCSEGLRTAVARASVVSRRSINTDGKKTTKKGDTPGWNRHRRRCGKKKGAHLLQRMRKDSETEGEGVAEGKGDGREAEGQDTHLPPTPSPFLCLTPSARRRRLAEVNVPEKCAATLGTQPLSS